MKIKSLRLLDLIRILKKYDKDFEFYRDRGKGSHHWISRPAAPGRKKESYPMKCHGKNPEIPKRTLKDIRRYFDLPEDIFS